MTDPVSGVSKSSEVERRKAAIEKFKKMAGNIKNDDNEPVDDTVSISDDARRRAQGRKTLQEYLEED